MDEKRLDYARRSRPVITRRTFLHEAVAAGAAAYGWLPLVNTIDIAYAGQTFKFAWVSDTHLYPQDVNSRFVDKAIRAVTEIQAMSPPAEFLIFGGDLAQRGDPVELDLGADILNEIKMTKVFIPGEHDWYLDMGKKWQARFGVSPWMFDHKGVRFIGIDTVSRASDYWTVRKMTPKERMAHMATLDSTVTGGWASVGPEQLEWMNRTLSDCANDQPVIIFSHNPLYEYYPPWNFWVRDWRELHEVLKPFKNVTNIHGHTHQVLYNEIANLRSIGMLATSWPWPYAPTGVPPLTKPMVRADPGDPYDGVGWGQLTAGGAKVEYEYRMWRKDIFADAPHDAGTGDNANQILSPRIADRD